jgi:hypothetical protein
MSVTGFSCVNTVKWCINGVKCVLLIEGFVLRVLGMRKSGKGESAFKGP